ncbi:hypothetical protein HOC01_03060 [archaeon]|jgi:hypothetical protein|nr:hypothetical protein [archaeon]MBT6698130.1 hypothetical protein [archaeon]
MEREFRIGNMRYIGIRRKFVVENENISRWWVNDGDRSDEQSKTKVICQEQLGIVYAKRKIDIEEIRKVHPDVCFEVMFGTYTKSAHDRWEDIILFYAIDKGNGRMFDTPESMRLIDRETPNKGYQCSDEIHSKDYSCGPWTGDNGQVRLYIETGEIARERISLLEDVCKDIHFIKNGS